MNRGGFLLVLVCVMTLFTRAFVFSSREVTVAYVADFQVSNLTCGACIEKIRGAVLYLDDNAEVQVDLAAGRARVVYDPSRTDASTIAGQISRAGYPTVVSPASAGPGAASATGGVRCPAVQPVNKSGCGGGCCG